MSEELGILELALNDPKLEPQVREEGSYRLIVQSVKAAESKKGNPMIAVSFSFADDCEADPVFDQFNLPFEGCDPKNARFFRQTIRNFCIAFNLPLEDPINPADWLNGEGEAKVTIEEYQGIDRNRIERYLPSGR